MLNRELGIFIVVGSLTVVVDFLFYRALVWSSLLDIDLAKGASFIIGTVFAYFSNRFWTFGHQSQAPGSAWRFCALYTTTLLVNVMVNSIALTQPLQFNISILAAFLLATGVSATLNFIGMKFFVFKSAHQSELQ
jgi:putative flippase GtrA